MEVSYSQYNSLLFLSFFCGIFLGVVYEMFRILRIFSSKRKIVVFVEDIIFFTFTGLCMSLIFYNGSRGAIRLYGLLAAAAGFLLYYLTVGKIINRFFNAVADAIKMFFRLKYQKIYTKYYKTKLISQLLSHFKYEMPRAVAQASDGDLSPKNEKRNKRKEVKNGKKNTG